VARGEGRACSETGCHRAGAHEPWLTAGDRSCPLAGQSDRAARWLCYRGSAALEARQRREEARAIAARDVNLARELRIGRPDLPRQFDDGGLVDLNNAPAPAMVQLLGLSEADVAQVTEARERIGGFSSAEEVIAYTDLPPTLVDGLRERLLFLR
jgi:hypothetical protein